MNQKYFIGIDISKGKLDCAVILSDYSVVAECIVPNNQKKIKSFLNAFMKKKGVSSDLIIVCCENTGIYNFPLRHICAELNIGLWEEHALRIKRASTDFRGKSDRKDAMRIAEYLVRYRDRMVLYKQPSEAIVEMDNLSKIRETLLKQKVAMQNQLREAKSHNVDLYKVLIESYKPVIASIDTQMKKVELKLQILLNTNKEMQQNVDLMTSVPGVGRQTALNFIIYTQNFTMFRSVKHLACYAGVVPFQNESGTIVKKARVSKMASQKLKSLLQLAAMASIRTKSELKSYYIRRVSEGKNKMSVLNAVRNKILHRIWAVIERQTPFIQHENFRPI